VFDPRLVPRVWGGDFLKRRVPDPPDAPIGESWEISDQDPATTPTASGWTLRDLMRHHRQDLTGTAATAEDLPPASDETATSPRFPLLLKLLDAQQSLSVQVHPDDDQAARIRPGASGKTECWYVLDAAPEARIYRGLQPGVTPARFADAARRGQTESLIHSFPVSAGDAVFVPAGTVHSIGAGVRLIEIQQTSDITFRVFDWNRLGFDGAPRELHLEQAMQVIRWEGDAGPDVCTPRDVDLPGCRAREIVSHPKLRVRALSGFSSGPVELDTAGERFHIVTVVSGSARIDAPEGGVDRGTLDSALIPAAAGRYSLTASYDATLLLFDRP
jgi:mannose-6-phosphate isomerase